MRTYWKRNAFRWLGVWLTRRLAEFTRFIHMSDGEVEGVLEHRYRELRAKTLSRMAAEDARKGYL